MSDYIIQCFVCGRRVGKRPRIAITLDGQVISVGRECIKKIDEAGEMGWASQDNPELIMYSLNFETGKRIYREEELRRGKPIA